MARQLVHWIKKQDEQNILGILLVVIGVMFMSVLFISIINQPVSIVVFISLGFALHGYYLLMSTGIGLLY